MVNIQEISRESHIKQGLEQQISQTYEQIMPETVVRLKTELEQNSYLPFKDKIRTELLIPFFEKVLPRIPINQGSLESKLSLISIKGTIQNEAEVVKYGLEPLLKADILDTEDVELISNWYSNIRCTRHNVHEQRYVKHFCLKNVSYILSVDSYKDNRDLNLEVVKH